MSKNNDPAYPFFDNFEKMTYFSGLDEIGAPEVDAHGTEPGWLRENISAAWYDELCRSHLERAMNDIRVKYSVFESTLCRLKPRGV